MATKIFVNLPVKDLKRTMDFFSRLGFTYNQQFTNDKAACMVVGEDIFVMLLVEPFFKGFTPKKEIADAWKQTEVLIALSADTKEQVNEMLEKALAAGGSEAREPEDHGFMYGRSFEDPDGHIWEITWMDPTAVNPS